MRQTAGAGNAVARGRRNERQVPGQAEHRRQIGLARRLRD
jgi:hypothetical protein